MVKQGSGIVVETGNLGVPRRISQPEAIVEPPPPASAAGGEEGGGEGAADLSGSGETDGVGGAGASAGADASAGGGEDAGASDAAGASNASAVVGSDSGSSGGGAGGSEGASEGGETGTLKTTLVKRPGLTDSQELFYSQLDSKVEEAPSPSVGAPTPTTSLTS